MEFEINGKKFSFKDKATGHDFLATRSEEEQEGAEMMIKMIVHLSEEPNKLTRKSILDLEYSTFIQLFTRMQGTFGTKVDFLEEK